MCLYGLSLCVLSKSAYLSLLRRPLSLTSILPLAPFSLNHLLNGLFHTPSCMNVEGFTQFRAWHFSFPRVTLWGEPVTSSCGFSGLVYMLYQPVCWNHEIPRPCLLGLWKGCEGRVENCVSTLTGISGGKTVFWCVKIPFCRMCHLFRLGNEIRWNTVNDLSTNSED